MKNFGMDLKRALDSHGIGASELAKTAGVTPNAVARWLKCIPFQRVKNPLAKSAICEGIFCLLPSGYRLVRGLFGNHSGRPSLSARTVSPPLAVPRYCTPVLASV